MRSRPAHPAFPALALAGLVAFAGASAAAFDPSAEPPWDPAIVRGELPNGLRYFLQPNAKPENRVELRLAIPVGSVQETEAERGLAHFAEHMQFNGSEHFPPGALVDYLESIGARFGADSNAYTSYDETVYMLQVPTDKPGALDQGLLVLADWAGRATFSGEEIDKERGVVGDELRRTKGAGKRIGDRFDQVIFRGSRYADRSTFGLEAVILNAPHDVLRGFYRRWYRPELLGVVVTGTFDPKVIEPRIRELFGNLPTSAERAEVPAWPVPPFAETRYAVESDPELTSSSVRILHEHRRRPTRTLGDQRRNLIDALAGYLLTQRLSERAQSPDPPFLAAGAGVGEYVKTMDVFTLFAQAKEGEIVRGADALMEELERARQHGFLEEELERAKASVLTSLENAFKERDQRRSRSLAGALVAAFLDGRPESSPEFGHEFAKELIPGLRLAEVSEALRRLTEPQGRVVLAQAPAKPGAVPSEADVRGAVEPAGGRAVAAYADDLAGRALTEPPANPGRTVSRHAIPEIGVTELRLSNGMRVVLKPTTFRADQIVMSAFAHGGTWGLPLREHLAAAWAAPLADSSGLGEFTAPQLEKLLAGKAAGASPSVGRHARGFEGGSTPNDFETMVQLVHLAFTRPAFREDAFKRIVDRAVESVRNREASPRALHSLAHDDVAYVSSEHYRPRTADEYRAVALDDVERHYRSFFDDPSEWTFVFAGNLDLDAHGALIATWLGGIPETRDPRGLEGRPRVAPGVRATFPQGPASRMVVKGVEDQAQTSWMIRTRVRNDEDAFDAGVVAEILRIRLRERLREERGDTYGVSVFTSSLRPVRGHARLEVSFGSSPDARGSMSRDVQAEVARLLRDLPTAAEVAKVRELRLKALADSRQENGWWLAEIESALEDGEDPRRLLRREEAVLRLTPESVRGAARRLLDPSRTAEVFLVPEGWGPSRWLAPAPSPTVLASGP